MYHIFKTYESINIFLYSINILVLVGGKNVEDNLKYCTSSLELNLFFLRIMKEHALFLEAGFTKANGDFAQQAECFKEEFEILLNCTINLSQGMIRSNVLNSGEIVTEFTLDAERQTMCLTGIDIDTDITQKEYQLYPHQELSQCCDIVSQISQLNQAVLALLEQFIQFKETIIANVESCAMFTMNYPLLLEHILREAKLYHCYLCNYEIGVNDDIQTMKEIEIFWNQIMMEHALFIRGLLDPTEADLIRTSNHFVKEYQELLECAAMKSDLAIVNGECNPYDETKKLKEFKTAGTKGILSCEIRSIIVPLLADHVLREANHYLRLLEE